jgi:hypothetical protein
MLTHQLAHSMKALVSTAHKTAPGGSYRSFLSHIKDVSHADVKCLYNFMTISLTQKYQMVREMRIKAQL